VKKKILTVAVFLGLFALADTVITNTDGTTTTVPGDMVSLKIVPHPSTSPSASPLPSASPTPSVSPTPSPAPSTGIIPIPAPLTGSVTAGSWVVDQVEAFPNSPSGYKGMQYNYLLPQGYNPQKYSYPLMFVGTGNDQGMNGSSYPRDGATFVSALEGDGFTFNTVAFRTAHPAIIVAPQCDQTLDLSGANPNANCGGYADTPNGEWNEQAISAVAKTMMAGFSVDTTRVYAVGLSLSAIGYLAALADNNQDYAGGQKIWTAAVGMSEQLYRPSIANSSVFQRMVNVPYLAISTPSDNSPSSWDQPFWTYITGNSNYPTQSNYDSGGMAAIRAGSSQFYYIADPGGSPWTTFGRMNADGGDGTALYQWLFSQTSGGAPQPSPTPSASGGSTVLTPTSGGSITDASGNVWTLTSAGVVDENGSAVAGGSGTSGLTYVSGVIWGEDAASGQWYSWTGGQWVGPSPSPVPVPTPTPQPSNSPVPPPVPTGNFKISGGRMTDPNGKPFLPEGVNLYLDDADVASFVANAPKLFPGLNYVRAMVYPTYHSTTQWTYPTVASLQAIAAQINLLGYVVEFEDHSSNGGYWEVDIPGGLSQVLDGPPTGTSLQQNLAFWSSMATAFKGNPYVWLGSLNELNSADGTYNPSAIAAISTYELALYNAIRATGNTNIIDLEAGIAGNPQTVGNGAGFIVADYAQMTNIIWWMHCYTDSGALQSLQGSAASHSGYLAAQTIQSADGIVPVIFNEYGSGSNANPSQSSGSAIASAIGQVASAGIGGGGFVFYNPNGVTDFSMTSGSSLTTWGQLVANMIKAVNGQ
jgi:hypothetical protein